MLTIRRLALVLRVLLTTDPDRRGSGNNQGAHTEMLNLVEKFTPAVEAGTNDAGLTTVEYAVAAAVVTAGAGALFLTLGGDVAAEIQDLINNVG
jgi:hypothetical protein